MSKSPLCLILRVEMLEPHPPMGTRGGVPGLHVTYCVMISTVSLLVRDEHLFGVSDTENGSRVRLSLGLTEESRRDVKDG
ncbi:hypothetical protein BDV12DRAFT_179938 [Aspergillus spectabilis]